MVMEKRLKSIATRAVGKRWGFGDMMPFCEDVNGEGRDETLIAGVGEDVVVGCGTIVVMAVWMSAGQWSASASV